MGRVVEREQQISFRLIIQVTGSQVSVQGRKIIRLETKVFLLSGESNEALTRMAKVLCPEHLICSNMKGLVSMADIWSYEM